MSEYPPRRSGCDGVLVECDSARGASTVCQELTADRVENDRLRDRLDALEREHLRVCGDNAALEQRISELGHQCVVMERLHGALDHREVLAAIQDCVINVIGSEELAIYEPSVHGGELLPAQLFGVEERHLGPVRPGSGPVGRAAAERRGWMVGDGPPPKDEPDLTACVPLEAGELLVGVLAIWRMLGHKPDFGSSDRRVLELLARHAGKALYLTSRSEHAHASPRERCGTHS